MCNHSVFLPPSAEELHAKGKQDFEELMRCFMLIP